MALEGRDDQLYQDRARAGGWPGLLHVCRDRPGVGCGGLDRSSGPGLSPILLPEGRSSGIYLPQLEEHLGYRLNSVDVCPVNRCVSSRCLSRCVSKSLQGWPERSQLCCARSFSLSLVSCSFSNEPERVEAWVSSREPPRGHSPGC